jgi:hypothetical protein
MLNHFWLISGATPTWPNAPSSVKAVLGPTGELVKDGPVTPDGYLVNTAFPAGGPHPATTPARPTYRTPLHSSLERTLCYWIWTPSASSFPVNSS